jgi:hypothetical protein
MGDPEDARGGLIPAEFPLGAEPIFFGGTAGITTSCPVGIGNARDFIRRRFAYGCDGGRLRRLLSRRGEVLRAPGARGLAARRCGCGHN